MYTSLFWNLEYPNKDRIQTIIWHINSNVATKNNRDKYKNIIDSSKLEYRVICMAYISSDTYTP